MLIKIHTRGNIQPIDVWENYPTIPNVGDKIGGYSKISMVVKERIFYKDEVIIIIE